MIVDIFGMSAVAVVKVTAMLFVVIVVVMMMSWERFIGYRENGAFGQLESDFAGKFCLRFYVSIPWVCMKVLALILILYRRTLGEVLT